MKKVISILGCVLCALVALCPLGSAIAACFGYTFALASVPGFSIVIAVFSMILVILSIIARHPIQNKWLQVLFALLPPIVTINAVFFMLENSSIWIIVCTFLSLACSVFLTFKHGRPIVLKIISLVLSAVLLSPLCFFALLSLIFGNISQNTVVKSLESPDGAYYVEVIDNNQGAMGGNTWVDVYENNGFDAVIFKVSSPSHRIYEGHWGEYNSMEIYWKNDRCLVINDRTYELP